MKIFSKVYFQPIHLLPFYKNTLNITPGSLPLTEKIANEILTIPLYPNMTTEEKDYLINNGHLSILKVVLALSEKILKVC